MTRKAGTLLLALLPLAAWMSRSDGGALQPPIDEYNSTATSNAGHLLVTPDGNGPTLAQEDLIITVQLLDANGDPVAGYLRGDIWWGDPTGGVVFCAGSEADTHTDADGVTHFTGAPCGGGWTQGGMRVYADSVAILGGPTGGLLPIDVNSPDINGDLKVDLVDLGSYATDYLDPGYQFRSDYNGDGVEDLRDVGVFASHFGEVCCLWQ